MRLPLEVRAPLSAAARAEVERAIGDATTLGELVQRGARVIDVVVQDEFTHDVVVAHAAERYLVFDST